MKTPLYFAARPICYVLCVSLAFVALITTRIYAQPIRSVSFKHSFSPNASILNEIHTSIAKADLGFLAEDEATDSSRVFMNYWFNTDVFDRIVHAKGFDLYPAGASDSKRISINELYFESERHALRALNRMDNWGLRNVAFLPPAHWFWIYFRGRILFITCSGMTPFEGVYKQVLDIVLQEVHRQRVKGIEQRSPQK